MTSRCHSDLPRLGELAVEASALARLAEASQVGLATARRALRRLGTPPENDGQRRFVERLSGLSRAQIDELRASVDAEPFELRREEDDDDDG